jgi:hypothetical protein
MVSQRPGADHSTHTPPTRRSQTMNFMTRAASPAASPSRVLTPLRELALLPLIEDPAPESDADFSRCGWFDSSLELAAGLHVTEFVDAVPADLPLQFA